MAGPASARSRRAQAGSARTTCSGRSPSGSTRTSRGIQAIEPGYAKIAFKPTIADGIEHVSASYDSVRGKAASSWTQTASGLVLDVTVPPNATGVVQAR
ncbi:MAG: alpha-L-rhamnosidase C-terminal domain-containing protein [Micromonosporaceae bacterium]